MTLSKTWHVRGMTCASCERTIGLALMNLPNVDKVRVSLKKNEAFVSFKEGATEPSFDEMLKELAARGYTLVPKDAMAEVCETTPIRPLRDRLKSAALWLAIVGIASFFILGPLQRVVPAMTVTASFGAMFLFGLVASVSTCLVSTGGYLLAYNGRPRSRTELISVHLGRLGAFIAGGAALGALGTTIPAISSSGYGILALVLGTGFLIVGLNMLDLAPSLAKLGIRLPQTLNRLGGKATGSQNRFAPYLVGAVTFVLPCGFTQTAQALALTSGSAFAGMTFLAAFGLGTLPVLAGLSLFGSVKTLKHQAIRLATGAVLTMFAFGQIDGGLTVLGSPVTPGSILASITTRAAESSIPAANAEEQIINMTVAYGTYSPKRLTIKKGIPVRWQIDGQDISGCASTIVAPSLGISKTLVPGMNVIQFTPQHAGTIPFSCGMGMIRGSFTVTN